jgi:UDP-N-acetyl-D-mannosaminuronate dehydrogenase
MSQAVSNLTLLGVRPLLQFVIVIKIAIRNNNLIITNSFIILGSISQIIVPNAPQAAAVRVLADFIFAFCFHFFSHNYFPYRQTPH